MKIVNVVGARPNFMKIAPLVYALEQRGLAQRLLHTGQHYDENMSKVFFEDLEMPPPDVYLGVGSVLLHGSAIGARSVVAAGAVVRDVIPEDAVAAGQPARVVKRLAAGVAGE